MVIFSAVYAPINIQLFEVTCLVVKTQAGVQKQLKFVTKHSFIVPWLAVGFSFSFQNLGKNSGCESEDYYFGIFKLQVDDLLRF
nr:hypothetical protein CFP56_75772 [Quercus suber]